MWDGPCLFAGCVPPCLCVLGAPVVRIDAFFTVLEFTGWQDELILLCSGFLREQEACILVSSLAPFGQGFLLILG